MIKENSSMDIFKDLFPAVDRWGKQDVFTPTNIVSDMLDLLPDDVWTPETTFLDPCCKTGTFLCEIYSRLDKKLSLLPEYQDSRKRRKHILDNQLFGLSIHDDESLLFSRRNVFGDIFNEHINVISTTSSSYIDLVKEGRYDIIEAQMKGTLGRMKFDVVVGNPPYNDDLYIYFVTVGNILSNQYTLMITPAKWQGKGGKRNEDFRENIVPYMSKIIYYINEKDIWENLMCTGGISYYLITKVTSQVKFIKNIYLSGKTFNGITIPEFNSEEYRSVEGCLNNFGHSIVKRLNTVPKIKIENFRRDLKYRFRFQKLFTESSKPLVINPPYIEDRDKPQKLSANYPIRFSSNDINEVKSFISYIYSKFARFLVLIGLCSTEMASDYVWRFVPDPGKFDHIFTDEELYKKYSLTDDEIKTIESVIKERKQ